MSVVLFIAFFALLAIGTPVAFALGIGALAALLQEGTFPTTILTQKMVAGVNSFPLVAVPLFIITGRLAGETGIAKRLVRLSTVLVGHIQGGLGLVNVLASMFFGGISGSAVADVAAEGSLIIPEMKKAGYDADYAAAITASSSTIGILIPPSIPMVIYGVTAGVSIGALFLAGLVPGILVGIFQMAVAYVISIKRGYPRTRRASLGEVWAALKDSYLALLLPLFILSAVAFGIATPTESAVIAVLYAFVLGVFVYREYELRQIPKLLVESAVSTAIACFVVAVASVVGWIVAIEQVPLLLSDALSALFGSPVLLLLIINAFLLVVGSLMDLVPAIILFAPILLPIAMKAGIDPIQFGAIMAVNLGIGLVTPPVGTCLFVASSISDVPILRLAKASLPFLLANTVVLLLVTFWQPLTTYIPRLLLR